MIYLDFNASTPIDEKVTEAMEPYIKFQYGNPSTKYELGLRAKEAIEKAREQVALLLNCNKDEIIFTSGGSESNNTVIKGIAKLLKNKGNHIITSIIEHPSVINVCKYLEAEGYKITYLPVDYFGVVSVNDLKQSITKGTILVSIMHANNETGAIQPIREISDICHSKGVLFHTDGSQSVGKIETDVNQLNVDYLTIAGHKLYAPKGVGALYVKRGSLYEPLIHGAAHESGMRAGTENVIFNVGLGKACEIAYFNIKNKDKSVYKLTEYFYDTLKKTFNRLIILNGHLTNRLPNTLNISFKGYQASYIVKRLDNVAVATGSACHSGSTSISPVLKAMKIDNDTALGALRFSLGRYTSKEEIDQVVNKLKTIIKVED